MAEQALFLLIVGVVVAAVIALLWFMVRSAQSKKKRGPGLSNMGWALLFLTSGRMPPPPPASQIEAELDGEKDRLGSRAMDPDEDNRRDLR